MHPKLYSKGNKSKKMDLFSKGLQATVTYLALARHFLGTCSTFAQHLLDTHGKPVVASLCKKLKAME